MSSGMWRGAVLALTAAVTHTVIDSLRKHYSAGLSPVALVGLVACLDAILACTGVAVLGGFRGVRFHDPHTFTLAVLTSSGLLLYSKYLYQQALATSHLSLTVPYLSFTPSFLVATAFLFLGEVPSTSGIVGVAIVTMGGYLLSKTSGSGSSSSSTGSHAHGSPGPATRGPDSENKGKGELGLRSGLKPGAGQTPTGSSVALHSIVIAYGSTPVGAVPRNMCRAGSSSGPGLLQGDGTPTHPLTTPRDGSISGVDADASVPSSGYALGCSADRLVARSGSRMGGRGAGAGGAQLLPVHEGSEQGGEHGPLKGASRMDTGQLMMVLVAAMWSVTATLDKLGCLHAPSVWVYFAMQRLVIGVSAAAYLAMNAPHTFGILRTRTLWLLLGLSILELSAVVMFLEAIKFVFVSYVVAIKRANILFSVVVGGLVFKESIWRRLPYVALMLAGMLCIVLEPGASSAHNTTHT